jgi:hypothetical protein
MKPKENSGEMLRRIGEAGFFAVLVGILWTIDTFTKFSQIRFMGHEPDTFRLVTEQVTSAVVVLLLIPGRCVVAHTLPVPPRPGCIGRGRTHRRQRAICRRALLSDGRDALCRISVR